MHKIQASLVNFFAYLRAKPVFQVGEIAKHRIFGLVSILEIRKTGWVAIRYNVTETCQVNIRTLRKNHD